MVMQEREKKTWIDAIIEMFPPMILSDALEFFLSTLGRPDKTPFLQITDRSSQLILVNIARFKYLVGTIGTYAVGTWK
jgi:hypothetical protein